MATLGYVRSSNGPDLAQVGANEQLVSHVFPNTTGETLRITSISAWVGNWSGQATMRFGIWAASSSSAAPGALLARTVEFSPSVSYVDAAGGQLRTVALETPYDLAPGQVIALGVASRNNSAGIAMYQASAISQPNESFYRRGISGTNMIAAGGEVTNQGQLAIYVTGSTNQPPIDPVLQSPSGNVTGGVTPVMTFSHRDPDGDRSSQAHIQVQTANGSTTMWDYTWDASITNQTFANRQYDGSALLFHTPYRWRARTRDTAGEWGPFSDWTNFTLRHNNHNPNEPSNFSGLGTVNGTRSLSVGADFTDPDYPTLPNGQAYEWFDAKQVRVRRLSDNVLVHNPGATPATTTERNNRRSSTSFTLPEWNVPYRWEERHRDRSGAWSTWAHVEVVARSGGSVDMPVLPAGRIANRFDPGVVSAIYRHSGGLTANATRVGLFDENGARIMQTPIIPNAGVAPGSPINLSWSTVGFGGLHAGTIYGIGVRARDTAGNWTEWSPLQTVVTNAPPTTPRLYGPPNGRVGSTIPELSVRSTDPDGDNSDISIAIQIYDDSETLLGSGVAPYNWSHDTDVFTMLATSVEAITGDVYGARTWRAQASDGIESSSWSEMWSYTYAPVPAVEITAPTGPTITTSQPQFTVVADAHTHWRVVGRDESQNIVYDTGEQAGVLTDHTVALAQYWIDGERWNNHELFTWTAMVRSAAGLWGSSDELALTLEYIPPDPLVIQSVEAMAFPGAQGSHYAAITTSQPDVDEESFIRTIVDRIEIDGPGGNENPDTLIPAHFDEGNSGVTSFADFDMTSNQWYRYAFRYEVQSGVDVIHSEPVFAEAMISFHGTLLHMPFDPVGTFVWLPYGEQRYEPEVGWFQGHSEVMTTYGRAPHGYSDSTDYVEWRCVSTLVAREGATVEQQRDALRRLWKYQNKRFAPNGRPNSVCFREGRGGDDGRVYGRISDPIRRHSYTRLYTAEFLFREMESMPVEGDVR